MYALGFRCMGVAAPITATALCALCCVLFAASATAQDASAAARAFQNAQTAELGGEPRRAAEFYEMADRIAPTPEALRSAARMRREAGDVAMAATHAAALLRRYPDDERSRELAEEILAESDGVARLRVECAPRCQLEVDGFASGTTAEREHVIYVQPGEHELVGTFPSRASASTTVGAVAGRERSVTLEEADADPPTSPAEARSRTVEREVTPGGRTTEEESPPVAPWVTLTAAALTVGAGAALTWSGLDTREARKDYDDLAEPTMHDYEDGLAKERRTNVLIGVTGVLAATTVVLALFTDWGADDEAPTRVGLGLSPAGGAMHLTGSF